MHAAFGHRTRYEIVYRLVHGDAKSPKELEEMIDINDSALHDHLNKLVDVGLARSDNGRSGIGGGRPPQWYRIPRSSFDGLSSVNQSS